MKNKLSLFVNLCCFFIPIIFFQLCLHNVETKGFGMMFVWGIIIVVSLVERYILVALGLLAVIVALIVAKKIRVPKKVTLIVLCLLAGCFFGVILFSVQTNDSDFFPMQN